MICEIHKCDSWENTLNYLESKLQESDKAIRFGENLFMDNDKLNYRSITQALKETIALNSRVSKENQIFHASINFDVTDRPTEDQLKEITQAYIARMGYSNCPYVTYKHTDKAHMHIHIFATNVDFDGGVVDRFNNFRLSQQFSRTTEKKYNLLNVEYEGNIKSSLRFINSSRFAFDKALRQTVKNANLTRGLEGVLNYSDFEELLDKPQNNNFHKAFFGSDAFFSAIDYFKKHEIYEDPIKQQLISKLFQIRDQSSAGDDFIKKLKREEIYVRRIFVKGKPTYTYGFRGLYVNEDRLPGEFSFNNLFSYKEDPYRNFEKKGLSTKAIQILKTSKDLDSFKRNLEKAGIEFITHENSGGIYGVSFKAKVEGKVEVFKGSELSKQHLTWNKIERHFSKEFSVDQNKADSIQHTFVSKTSYNIGIFNNKISAYSKGFNNFSSYSTDFSPELLNKKRKRHQERD